MSEDSSVILSDSFDNNDNNWPLGDYGSIENGQLILSKGDISVLPANIQFVNGRIKASLIYTNGDPLSAAEVIAYKVVEPETLGVVEIARTLSDNNGAYSFYLPEDSSYFIEAGTPDKKFTGDRYADLQIPDSGLDLNITITEAK